MTAFGMPPDQLVGHVDVDGRVRLLGWNPGPAGIALLRLAGGRLEVEVDAADPDTLVAIDFDGPPGTLPAEVRRALQALVGFEVVDGLPGLGPEARIVWRPPRRSLREPDVSLRGVPRPLGRLALLLAERTEHRLTEVESALADLEAGTLGAALPSELHPEPAPERLLVDGAQRVLDLGGAAALGAGGGPLVSGLLREAALRLPPREARLADALRRIVMPGREARVREDALSDLAAPPVAAPAPAPAPATGVAAPPALPVHVAAGVEAEVTGARLLREHLEVHIAPGEAGIDNLWLRVFRGEARPVPLALGPFRRDGATAVARVLLPPGEAPGGLAAEVTSRPVDAWRSDTLRPVQNAVTRGRTALRHERRDEFDAASAAWIGCAESWEEAGDARRADLAHQYAAGHPGRPPRRPAAPYAFDTL